MARKDVIKYFLEQQNLYFEMLDDVKEFDIALKKGIIEQDAFDNAQKDMKIVKDNYERLAYIVMLLNKPKRKDKEKLYNKLNDSWYKELKGSSREAIYDESKDALSDFKKLIKEKSLNDK